MSLKTTPQRDGSVSYVTQDGDMVDLICWRFYGTEGRGTTERIFDTNHGLAGRGPILPPGIPIRLPSLPGPQMVRPVLRLWD